MTDISLAIRPFPHPVSSLPGPLFLLNAEEIAEEIGNMWRTIYKLTKTFTDVPAPRRLAENVKVKIDKFKQHIPILTISCNPGMKDRHWQQVPVTVLGPGGPLGGGNHCWLELPLPERRICLWPRGASGGCSPLGGPEARSGPEQPPLHVGGWTLLFRDPRCAWLGTLPACDHRGFPGLRWVLKGDDGVDLPCSWT